MSRLILAALLALPLSIASCGGDSESDADATETTENEETESSGNESSSADGAVADGSMSSLQRELNEIIIGIESKDDVEAAESDIDAVFDRMADLVRNSDLASENMATRLDPEYHELQRKMNEHVQQIAKEDPQAMMALSKILARNSGKMLEAAGERLGGTEEGMLKGAQKLLEEAEESSDEAAN